MTKFKTSDRNDQSVDLLADAALDVVVGGSIYDILSPQLRLAATPVGGWDMKDIWARPTLGHH